MMPNLEMIIEAWSLPSFHSRFKFLCKSWRGPSRHVSLRLVRRDGQELDVDL